MRITLTLTPTGRVAIHLKIHENTLVIIVSLHRTYIRQRNIKLIGCRYYVFIIFLFLACTLFPAVSGGSAIR